MIFGGTRKIGGLTADFTTALLIGLMLCSVPAPAPAASVLTIAPQQQLGLADRFFEQGEYDAAVTEYHRFRYFFPNDPRADYAAFRTGRACFLRGDYEKALSLFENLYRAGSDNRYGIEACFMLSRCYQALGSPDRAVGVLKELLDSTDDSDVRDRARYQIGWIYLEAPMVLDKAAVDRAEEYFAGISDTNRTTLRVKTLTERLQGFFTDPEGPLLSRKNPGLAGALAAVPGGGYVYCGRYHDALMSFVFIGGMGYAAWEAFDKDLEGLGALISLVGGGFYAGNIYGSISAAHKYNRTLSRKFLGRLKQARISFTPSSGEKGAMVFFNIPF